MHTGGPRGSRCRPARQAEKPVWSKSTEPEVRDLNLGPGWWQGGALVGLKAPLVSWYLLTLSMCQAWVTAANKVVWTSPHESQELVGSWEVARGSAL